MHPMSTQAYPWWLNKIVLSSGFGVWRHERKKLKDERDWKTWRK
jgi:hypothetical protein